MKWKLTFKNNKHCIENEGGKVLSYNPNLGIQIIEQDGYAFKDLNNSGELEAYEDWRLPMSIRVKDFTERFVLWQEKDCLFYKKGKIQMPEDICFMAEVFRKRNTFDTLTNVEEDTPYLEDNYIIVLLLLMFDNDCGRANEDYLLQLIMQSMDLGLLENIMYSLWEALKKFVKVNNTAQLNVIEQKK